ncbi:hypothetical protein BP6252_07553 [Coleophoma cylindrospora]|uniref:Uncharacterized protein n=1 Tax=Coleophoma cylindrospora TaxID=1849047 RepID=A0A3D8RAJ0_9HELO|nr:hypothetical protein BP6252_07553 [Coleophoma cylindrospora]
MRSSGRLFSELYPSNLPRPKESVKIESPSFVASYNWKNSDNPEIFVPGCPAKWSPPDLPYMVPKDNGQAIIDQNSHRIPSASFDPFFKALLRMNPSFDMTPIELITDRNSLRKLLRFVSGKVPQSWRIDVDIVEDTMFFTRWEENRVQIITGSRDSGYGHEFEKAFLEFNTALQESSGHHRIIWYSLGGIECLVRFEADGYISNDPDVDDRILTKTVDGSPAIMDEIGALSLLQIQDSIPATEVQVIERGCMVSDDDILELKSCSGNLRMQEIIPQLWISQTQHLFVGRHKKGLVEVEPEKIEMRDHFPIWQYQNQGQLSSLVGLIGEIKKVARGSKVGKLMLVCKMEERPNVLRLYERTGQGLWLPEGTREMCWGRRDGDRGH